MSHKDPVVPLPCCRGEEVALPDRPRPNVEAPPLPPINSAARSPSLFCFFFVCFLPFCCLTFSSLGRGRLKKPPKSFQIGRLTPRSSGRRSAGSISFYSSASPPASLEFWERRAAAGRPPLISPRAHSGPHCCAELLTAWAGRLDGVGGVARGCGW